MFLSTNLYYLVFAYSSSFKGIAIHTKWKMWMDLSYLY